MPDKQMSRCTDATPPHRVVPRVDGVVRVVRLGRTAGVYKPSGAGCEVPAGLFLVQARGAPLHRLLVRPPVLVHARGEGAQRGAARSRGVRRCAYDDGGWRVERCGRSSGGGLAKKKRPGEENWFGKNSPSSEGPRPK
jgi:hypothetical protein